jgi:flavin reductase (DIM6/NTAB) family NADH-FMN oxidoreductase RutF
MSAPETPPPPPFDTRAFRRALGTFPTGVTIVTTVSPEGRPVGLTCNSFSSVSLSPPLILWSLALHSPSLPAFLQAPRFAVNVLSAGQLGHSTRFSQPLPDKFENVAWAPGEGGLPLITDAAAHLECRNETRHYTGDHVIFIGRVLRFAYNANAPLVFAHGEYRVLTEHPGKG